MVGQGGERTAQRSAIKRARRLGGRPTTPFHRDHARPPTLLAMVETAVAPPAAAPPRRPRPWWRTLWFIAPLLFLVLLAVARVVYWRTSIAYQPLRLAGSGAPAAGQPAHVAPSAGGLRSTAPTGTDQAFEFPVRNTGIHPLDITAVTVQDDNVVGVQW